MSGITVELSELDADLWEAFKRGGAWVAHSEYMKLKAENAKLRELVEDMWRDRDALSYGAAIPTLERMRELGVGEVE